MGYTVGAGILGIPYAISRVGLLPGLLLLVFLGLASMIVNLMIVEIMMRTRFRHQLVGLMKKYLGNRLKHVQAFAMLVGGYGALTAYIVGQGEVLASIFHLPNSQLFFSLIFVGFGILILFFGLRLVKVVELWLVLLIVIIVLIISFLCLPAVQTTNFNYPDWTKILIPYGVLLFAFGGQGAIFSIREILYKEQKKVKSAVMIGGLSVMLIYTLFTIMIVGVTGLQTTQIATIGLEKSLGSHTVLASNIFAFLAMMTSFLTVGLSVRQIYRYDYRLPVWLSWLLIFVVPLLIFLFVSQSFIQIISIAGSLTFGLSGILIVWTFWKSRKAGDQSPEYKLPNLKIIGAILMIIFAIGIIYTLKNIVI